MVAHIDGAVLAEPHNTCADDRRLAVRVRISPTKEAADAEFVPFEVSPLTTFVEAFIGGLVVVV